MQRRTYVVRTCSVVPLANQFRNETNRCGFRSSAWSFPPGQTPPKWRVWHWPVASGNNFSLIGKGRGEARSNGGSRAAAAQRSATGGAGTRFRIQSNGCGRVAPGGPRRTGARAWLPRRRAAGAHRTLPPPATSPIRCTPRPPASRWRVEPYAVGGGAASEALGGGVGRGAGLVARQRPANRQSLVAPEPRWAETVSSQRGASVSPQARKRGR